MILGVHSDNSSEFINHVVARWVNTLGIQQTKSRSRQCNDHALGEGKNRAIVRKHLGPRHIPSCHAARISGLNGLTRISGRTLHIRCP